MINVHVIYLRRLAEAATTDLETQNLSDAADALAVAICHLREVYLSNLLDKQE